MIAKLVDGGVMVKDCYDVKDEVKSISGSRWVHAKRHWLLPLNDQTMDLLKCYTSPVDWTIQEEWNKKIAALELINQLKTSTDHVDVKMPVRCTPFAHQRRGYLLGLANEAFCYLLDMGTGKSLIAIAVMGTRYARGEISKVLVICPKTLMYVWQAEIAKYADFSTDVLVLDGPLTSRADNLRAFSPQALGIVIVNYDAVDNLLPALKMYAADLIVLDECQRIKSRTAGVSKACHKLGGLTPYRYVMSGTIIQNKLTDAFSIFKFLDPSIFGTSYSSFEQRYCRHDGWGPYAKYQITGYQNTEEFKEKLHSISFRATKEEVLDLPDWTDEIITLKFEPAEQRFYDNFKRDMYVELSEGEISATNVLTKLLRLQEITGGFVHRDGENYCYPVNNTKKKALSELLDSLVVEGEQSICIFCRFTEEFNQIKQLLEHKKISHVYIDGSVSSQDREKAVYNFQNSDTIKVFLGQIQCVSTGLTLTRSSKIIYYSLNFNYADYEQSRARIHRISQQNPCCYIHLVVQGTVDELILSSLQAKRSLSEDVQDKWRGYINKSR